MNIFDFSNYSIGIIWALGSNVENNKFSIRHREKYFLEQLSPYFKNSIYKQKRTNKQNDEQYVLKVSGVDSHKLYEMGWSPRNSQIRDVPLLSDYKDFIRAYVEIHSSLDYSTRYKRDGTKYKSIRLRIYGNVVLVNSINMILSQNAKVGIKTVQVRSNNKTSILHYSSLFEIQNVFDYIFGEPRFNAFWTDVENKLMSPTKEFIGGY